MGNAQVPVLSVLSQEHLRLTLGKEIKERNWSICRNCSNSFNIKHCPDVTGGRYEFIGVEPRKDNSYCKLSSFCVLRCTITAAVKHYWKAQRQCAAENTFMAHATLTVALNTAYSGKCKFLQILSGGCMNHQILQLQILRLCSNFTPAASSLNRNVCPLVLMAPPQLWICSNQLRMGFSPQISDGLQLGASTKNCSEKTHSISAWISPCDICQWKNKLTVEKLLVWNFSVGNLQFSSVLSLVENVFYSNPWR